MFNWPQFLASHGVHFVTRGPNTGRDQVSVRCPWCGEADPSEHLAISLKGAGYRCWRNPRAHSGKSRARLIAALIRCSFEEAQRLAGEDLPPLATDDEFAGRFERLLGEKTVARPTTIAFPAEIKPLRRSVLARPYWAYLEDRGYSPKQADWMARAYNFHYARQGRFAQRIVIPIEGLDRRLKTWTARAIRPDATLRYRTVPLAPPFEDYDGPLAVTSDKHLLLGLPLLMDCRNPDVLVLCEGPFDAIRLTTFGYSEGVYSTCLFGLSISDQQIGLLDRLMARFRRLVVLLDPGAQHIAWRIRDALQPLRVKLEQVPADTEDPGALTERAAALMISDWRRGLAYATG